MNKTVIIIKTENAIEIPKDKSKSHVGIGRIKTAKIAIIPKASAMSVLFVALASAPKFEATPEFFELELVSLDVSVIIQRSVFKTN
tara:strand:- start:961 stop:1218 length:258 start_codon:yes stop_codon:yes gene_type:complete